MQLAPSERLLVDEGSEAVLGGDLLHDLHHHQVLVNLLDHRPLVLARRATQQHNIHEEEDSLSV